MTQLTMTNVPIDTLSPNPWNTNKITDPADRERLRTSLKRFGVFKPIIVRELENGSLQILGGQHRWEEAKSLGHKTAPVVNLGRMDERRAKEIGLVDNARYGDDDFGELGKLVADLGKDIFAFIPFSEADFKALSDASGDFDLDDLDKLDAQPQQDQEQLPKVPTSQLMRFKVPIADSTWVTQLIEQEMKTGGFKQEDDLTNAGHALVSLLNRVRKA